MEVITELYQVPRYGGSNYTVTAIFTFSGDTVSIVEKTWFGGCGSGNEDVIKRRISYAEYNEIARSLLNRIKVTAGGYYGDSSAYYQVNDGVLKLLEPAPTMNLAGNNAANEFDGVSVGAVESLRKELIAQYRHNKERCGCHLCGFDITIEPVPDLPVFPK